MGLFSASSQPMVEPTPISAERLVGLFDQRGWKYFVDNEGDLGGYWDDNRFYFLVRGSDHEILHVQGLWHLSLRFERLEEVRSFIEQWHRDHLWPKCYHRITDEGRIRVFTENTVDWEHGATDEQLLQQISCALGTSAQFFDTMAEALGV